MGVEGIWRRFRTLFGGESPPPRGERVPGGTSESRAPADSQVPGRYAPDLPMSPGYQPDLEPQANASVSPVAAPSADEAREHRDGTEEPLQSPEELAESLSLRLLEDETLRGNLTDDEFQPFLDWALKRIDELSAKSVGLPQAQAVAGLRRAGDQVRDLLRLIDLVVGERAATSPDLVASRLQLLDTLLEPPLFDPQAARLARARLDALLAEPPERLQSMDSADLTRRLLGLLE